MPEQTDWKRQRTEHQQRCDTLQQQLSTKVCGAMIHKTVTDKTPVRIYQKNIEEALSYFLLVLDMDGGQNRNFISTIKTAILIVDNVNFVYLTHPAYVYVWQIIFIFLQSLFLQI